MTIVLPKQKHVPSTNLSDYVLLFAGEKKIGKTSIVSQFSGGNTLIGECEPGNADHIECYKIDIGSWGQFEQMLSLLEQNPTQYGTVCIDEIPNLFRYCQTKVMQDLGIDTMQDAAYGKAWDLLRNRMMGGLARLQSLPIGVIYTAHTEVREYTDRTGQKCDRLEINAAKMLNQILDGCVNTWLVFLYNKEGDRYCVCQADSFIKAGVGFPNNFRTTDGRLLKTFPLGESPQEAYSNIIRAFNNEFSSTGSENYEQPILPPKANSIGQPGRQAAASGGTMQQRAAANKFIK